MITENWYYDGRDTLHLNGYRNLFINRSHRRGGGGAIYVEACGEYELIS